MSTHHNLAIRISGGIEKLRDALAFIQIDKRIKYWRIGESGRLELSANNEAEPWQPFPARLSIDSVEAIIRDYLTGTGGVYIAGKTGFHLRVVPKCFCVAACDVCGAPDRGMYDGFRVQISAHSLEDPLDFKISGEFSHDEIQRNLRFVEDFFQIRFDGNSTPLADGGFLLGACPQNECAGNFSRMPAIAILIGVDVKKQVEIPLFMWDEGSPGYLLEYLPAKNGFGSLVVRPYACFWHK